MNVAVIGTGYVGLVTGVGLALRGHSVICVDQDPEIVRRLQAGEPTIHEAGLAEALRAVREAGSFDVSGSTADAVARSELTILAVGTPSDRGAVDLSQVRAATTAVGEALRGRRTFHTVVVKSTVVPGTTDTAVRDLLERASGLSRGRYGLGMNPEFLREGTALEDFVSPDRIVLGADDAESAEVLTALYHDWEGVPLLQVPTRTAELIKYANNALLATHISFANELARIAEAVGGIDILDVLHGVQLDKRWSWVTPDGERVTPPVFSYLVPGCGYGGSCLPKDVAALAAHGKALGEQVHMLEAVQRVNAEQPLRLVPLLDRLLGGLGSRRVAVLGVAFKPGTDDVRHSPSLPLIDALKHAGASVAASDPVATVGNDGVDFLPQWRDAVEDSDAVVVVTGWPEYQEIDPADLQRLMRGNLVLDPRGVCRQLEHDNGLRYWRSGTVPSEAESSRRLEDADV